jgi:hypothetical protein
VDSDANAVQGSELWRHRLEKRTLYAGQSAASGRCSICSRRRGPRLQYSGLARSKIKPVVLSSTSPFSASEEPDRYLDGFVNGVACGEKSTRKAPLTRRISERVLRAAEDKWRLPELYWLP